MFIEYWVFVDKKSVYFLVLNVIVNVIVCIVIVISN